MADATGQTVTVRIGATSVDGRRRRVLGERHDDHVPRLSTRVRRGQRRSRRRARGPRATAARRSRSVGACPTRGPRAEGPHDDAPGSLHRGVAREAARGAGHRPTVHVRVDHADDPGPRLRVEEGPRPGADHGPRSRSSTSSNGTSTTLVDYAFTAAHGGRPRRDRGATQRREGQWLGRVLVRRRRRPGLKRLVRRTIDGAIDAAEINAIPLGVDGDGRTGRRDAAASYGPYVKRGEDTASVPEDMPPDELTLDKALELLAAPKGDDPIGTDPATGLPVYAKNGRYGPYVQLGDADTLPDEREAEDGVAVQDDDPRTAHARRRPRAALTSTRRSAPIRPTAKSSRQATAGTARSSEGQGLPSRSTPRSGSSRSPLDEALALLAQPEAVPRSGRTQASAARVRPRSGVRAVPSW